MIGGAWQEEFSPVIVGNCDSQLSSCAYQYTGLVLVLLFRTLQLMASFLLVPTSELMASFLLVPTSELMASFLLVPTSVLA